MEPAVKSVRRAEKPQHDPNVCEDHTGRAGGVQKGDDTASAALGPRLQAVPIKRILSRVSGQTVGYVYEWDNGEHQPMWLANRVRAVDYAPIESMSLEFDR